MVRITQVISVRESLRAKVLEGGNGLISNEKQAKKTRSSPRTHSGSPKQAVNGQQNSVPVSRSFIEGHPFWSYILRPTPIEFNDVENIVNQINFHLAYYENTFTMPASTNPKSGYVYFAWTRDMAIKALSLSEIGDVGNAQKVINNLAKFYGRLEERGRFTAFFWDNNPKSKYIAPDKLSLPQIRAYITESGEMVESPQNWQHNQLDAIGMWLWVTFKLANENKIKLSEIDKNLVETVNHQNGEDSIFSVALSFLNRIEFWDQFDVGPWEDYSGYKRASSLGICLAAFKEAKNYFENRDWNSISIWDKSKLKAELENGIINGEHALRERVPEDGREAIETDTNWFQKHDSALIFLLYPFNPNLSPLQEKAILKTVYEHRMGEVGFSRRDNDNYVGMDYPYNDYSEGIYSNTFAHDYKAAEWTLFDPLLAAFYYKKYVDSKGSDEDSLLLADRHLKRSLAQVTKGKDSYTKSYWDYCYGKKSEYIEIEDKIIPEAYWYDTHEQRWRANENSPLLMAEAAYLMMLKEAASALALREKILTAV